MMRKNFAADTIFASLSKLIFFVQTLMYRGFKKNHHIDKYSGDEKLACTGGAAPMYLCGMIKNQLPPHNTLHQSIDLTSPQ